jgi:hypothetical protein
MSIIPERQLLTAIDVNNIVAKLDIILSLTRNLSWLINTCTNLCAVLNYDLQSEETYF